MKSSKLTDFQTPLEVAEYMCSLIPRNIVTVLEPTPGKGNIVSYLGQYKVTAPDNFFYLPKQRFDCIVMNPPFSSGTAFGIPDNMDMDGLKIGYYILEECMEMSDHVIALMPWFTIIDSDVRLKHYKKYGLKSITSLPRKTFQYTRIQTCILELHKGWKEETIFKVI